MECSKSYSVITALFVQTVFSNFVGSIQWKIKISVYQFI